MNLRHRALDKPSQGLLKWERQLPLTGLPKKAIQAWRLITNAKNKAIQVASMATTVGASLVAAQAVSAAWAPAAALASLATFGGNAAPASAGIASTVEFAKQQSIVPGLADGGIVRGPGGSRDDRILAMLSDGEMVMNARATRENRAELESMNRGRNSRRPMVNTTFNITTPDADSFRNSRSQLIALQAKMVRRAELL